MADRRNKKNSNNNRFRVIQGEKDILKKDDKITEEMIGRPLTKEEKHKKHKKQHKKMKRKVIIAGMLASIGITAVTVKLLNEAQQQKTPTEMTNNKENEFKESIKYKSIYPEKSKTEKEINELENQQDLLSYLKDKYIEQYEKITGDTNLTTEDITIEPGYENFIYVDENTGKMITHGENPEGTKQVLEQDNISYTTKDNIYVYNIKDKEGNIIDCATNQVGQEALVKVIPGDRYQEMKEYTSTLTEMGNVIPDGIKYWENIEKDKDDGNYIITKSNFIKSAEGFEKQEEKTVENEEMEIE